MWPLKHLFKQAVSQGTLRVYDADGTLHEFSGTPAQPTVTMRLHDKKLYRSLFLNGKMTLGEAYTDGKLTFEDGSNVHDF